MTNDQEAANRFMSMLQEQPASSDKADPPEAEPSKIIINRPVRCTFVFGDDTTPTRRRTRRTSQRSTR